MANTGEVTRYCPRCGQRVKARADRFAKALTCPSCQRRAVFQEEAPAPESLEDQHARVATEKGERGFVGGLVHRFGKGGKQDRFLAEVEALDQRRDRDSAKTRQEYERIVTELEALEDRDALTAAGQAALGQAYWSLCLIALRRGDHDLGLQRLQQVRAHVAISDTEALGLVAEGLLKRGAGDRRAAQAFLAYLHRPTDELDAKLSRRVLEALETAGRITEGPGWEKDLRDRIQLNLAVASLPQATPCLVILRGRHLTDQCVLDRPVTRIGRGANSDLVLRDPTVSSDHAKLEKTAEGYVLTDLQSSNGTRVRGERIREPVRLDDGEVFFLGNIKVVFYARPRGLGGALEWPRFNLGVGYFLRGKDREAERFFKRALRIEYEKPDSHWYVGRIFARTGREDEAIERFSSTIRRDPKHLRARLSWVELLLQQAEAADATHTTAAWRDAASGAVELLQQARRLAPKGKGIVRDLATLLAELERTEEALDAIGDLIELDPDVAAHHVFQAREARKLGQDDLAWAAASRALELDETHVEAAFLVGDLAFERQDYATAARRLQWVQAEEEERGAAVYSATPGFAQRLGRALYEVGRFRQAIAALETVTVESRDAMFYCGRAHSRSGLFEPAAELFAGVLECFGEEQESRYFLAATLGNLERYEAGLSAAEPLLQDADWRARAVSLRVRLLMRLGRLEEAEAELSAAAAGPATAFEHGRMACMRGDYAAAATHFATVVETDGADPEGRYWLARALHADGQHEAAEKHFQTILAAEKDDSAATAPLERAAEARAYLGAAARAQGKPETALTHLQKAQQQGLGEDWVAFELALASAACGRYAAALTAFSALLVEHKGDPVLARNLAVVSASLAAEKIRDKQLEEAVPLLEQAQEQYAALDCEEALREVNAALAEIQLQRGVDLLLSGPSGAAAGVAALEASRALDQGRSLCLYLLSVGYLYAGRAADAVDLLQTLQARRPDDATLLKALAFALEQNGQGEDAVRTWTELMAAAEPKAAADGHLGLAGYHARQNAWAEAAEVLHVLLDKNLRVEGLSQEALAKLAMSYFTMAGDDAASEEIIRDHLADISKEMAALLLGAVLAKQERYSDAWIHLRDLARKGGLKKHAEVRPLCEGVVSLLAAEAVLAGDTDKARALLKEAEKAMGELGAAAQSLLDAMALADSLGGGTAQVDAKTLDTFERALKANPDVPVLRRNVAILAHRLAIDLEGQGKTGRELKKLWERGDSAWFAILEDGSGVFWKSFLEEFNRERRRRERLEEGKLELLAKRLRERLVEMHRAYAVAYVEDGQFQGQMVAHAEAATKFHPDGKYALELAEHLLSVGMPLYGSDVDRHAALREGVIAFLDGYSYARKKRNELREGVGNIYLNTAIDALAEKNVNKFQRLAKKSVPYQTGDFRDLLKTAAECDRSYLNDVVTCAARHLRTIHAEALQSDKGKVVLFQVVLRMAYGLKQNSALKYSTADRERIIQESVMEFVLQMVNQ